jgi:tyrosine-protein kinase Etk/Wzc
MGMNPKMRMDEDDIKLLEYWEVIRKRLWMILGFSASVMFATGFCSYYILPKIYEATATILAPKEPVPPGLALLTQFGAQAILGGNLAGGSSRDTFVAILKSRTMLRDLVERFGLKEYYRSKNIARAVRELEVATAVGVSKEGVISITVADKNPNLAADIANAYVTYLDRVFAKLGTTEASRQRAFIVERLDSTEKTLRNAEEALRRFQESNRAVVLDAQSKTVLEAAARLKGEIVAAEVQMKTLATYSTSRNPDVIKLKQSIDEMNNQLSQMQYGGGTALASERSGSGQPRQELSFPTAKVPVLAMELARLMRDVKVQETVFGLLNQQFEQAKIAEARDTPTVQLLDKALPAEEKSRPKTLSNMVIAGELSLVTGVLLAFLLEYIVRRRRRMADGAKDGVRA